MCDRPHTSGATTMRLESKAAANNTYLYHGKISEYENNRWFFSSLVMVVLLVFDGKVCVESVTGNDVLVDEPKSTSSSSLWLFIIVFEVLLLVLLAFSSFPSLLLWWWFVVIWWWFEFEADCDEKGNEKVDLGLISQLRGDVVSSTILTYMHS